MSISAQVIVAMNQAQSSTRDVDILPPVIEALMAQRAQQAAFRLKRGEGKPETGKDYVFTGPEGGSLNLNYLREKIWHTTLAEAKLRRRTFYQTRHTFASNALAAGENPKWVADMLGHKSTQILFDVYEKFIPRRTRMDGSALLSRMREESMLANPDAEEHASGSLALRQQSRLGHEGQQTG